MQSILLIGRPGSGKGTQAVLLKEKLNFEIIALGDLLRKKTEKDNFTGKKIKKMMNFGDLLPTIAVIPVWYEELNKLKNSEQSEQKNIILDGFARKFIEAELLLQAINWFELGINFKVIYVDISTKESKKRISKRKMCNKCGAIFMANYQEKKCNKCDGFLIIRGDQSEKAIKKREQEFQKETIPVLEFFKEKGLLESVNGEQSVEAVFEEITKKLKLFEL